MQCPKCRLENPDTSRFCAECGTQLQQTKDIDIYATETLEIPKGELTPGSIFAGRYQVIEELGKGGMGKIYKVFDKEISAKIALKLLKPEIVADKNTVERFRNELKVAREISHKNICRMYDLGRDGGLYYITMEYVPGEDLRNMIRMSRQLGVGTAIIVAEQICDGLAEAHRHGTIHRDLKPSNIMIDRDGNVRDHGFRDRPLSRSEGPDRRGNDHRNARIHVSRTGGGQRRRPAFGHLFPRASSSMRC